MKKSIFLIVLLFLAFSNSLTYDLHAESDTLWTKYIGSTVRKVKFSPDGRFVYAAITGRSPLMLDASTGEILQEFKEFTYSDYLFNNALDISTDGKMLVGGDFHKLYIFDTESGKVIDSLESNTMNFEYNRFNDVVFAQDNNFVIACLDYASSPQNTSSKLLIWDKNTKKIVKEINGTKIINLAKNDNNSKLAFIDRENDDNSYFITLLEIGTWKELGVLNGHQNRITDLSFSPDGSLLASCDDNRYINIFEIEKKELKINFRTIELYLYSLELINNNSIVLGNGDWNKFKLSNISLENLKETYSIPVYRPRDFSFYNNTKVVIADLENITVLKADRLSSIPFTIGKDKLYPNPTNQNLTIPKTYFNENLIYINIIDMSGKEVFRYNKTIDINFYEDMLVDVSRYLKGSYIVQFFYKNSSMPVGVKFIKDF
jgi:WD40 repeat protein